jgi:acetyltransferase-like isoleucine patch superfamily enzyme
MLAWAIACVPSRLVRGWLYGLFPGYSIHLSSRIGWLSLVDVDSLSMGAHSRVGTACRIVGPMRVELGAGAVLGGRNRVECGRWYAEFDTTEAPYAREFILGAHAIVTSDHYFDAIGGIRIGEGSWVAGRGSQFWTHGLGVLDRSVSVGRYTYIGSASRFAPGARVGSLAVVGLGSVVTSDLSSHDQVLIAGVPAAVVREDYRPRAWDALREALADGRVAYR